MLPQNVLTMRCTRIVLAHTMQHGGIRMAYKMAMSSPYKGMPFIWNISKHVGVLGSCPNAPEDVELVQLLIIERYKLSPPNTPRASGIGFLQYANGMVDVRTGFEIYWAGDHGKPLTDSEVISPAKYGSLSYGSGMWTIGWLNHKLHSVAPQVWGNIPNLCSPQLKLALTTKTSP